MTQKNQMSKIEAVENVIYNTLTMAQCYENTNFKLTRTQDNKQVIFAEAKYPVSKQVLKQVFNNVLNLHPQTEIEIIGKGVAIFSI